jgi:predicted nucleic acid-binding protein
MEVGVIVLDSSFLVAFHNSTDRHHDSAAGLMAAILEGRYGNPLLLEYVFLETVTVILLRRGRETATAVADRLLDAREVVFVACSELFLETLRTFRRQSGANLGFVDCAVLTAARRHEPGWVATFDKTMRAADGIRIPPG